MGGESDGVCERERERVCVKWEERGGGVCERERERERVCV